MDMNDTMPDINTDRFNEVMPETNDRVLCMRITKPISGDGYKYNFLPRLEAMVKAHNEIRILVVFEHFLGWEEDGALADLASSVFLAQHLKKFAAVNLPEQLVQYMGVRQNVLRDDFKIFNKDDFENTLNGVKE